MAPLTVVSTSALAQAPDPAPDPVGEPIAVPSEPAIPEGDVPEGEPVLPASVDDAVPELPVNEPLEAPVEVPAPAPVPTPAPAPAPVAVAAPAPAPAPAGGEQTPAEELFATSCGSCHSIGEGTRVGPDLKGAHERRSADWLKKMIKTPSAMLDSDADAKALLAEFNGIRMPDLGLTDAEVDMLADLIARCSTQSCNLAGQFVAITTATDADAALGRELFLGTKALSGGGPPCISCHTAAGSGSAIAGGNLALNLTHVFARLGDVGLDGALKNPPFPLMKDIYAEQKLSKEEVFALRAFFSASNRTVHEDDSFSLVLASLIGTILCLLILNFFWRRRLLGVRKPMLNSQGVPS